MCAFLATKLGARRCRCRENLVGVAGFEPATPSSRTRCSTRLSHTPMARFIYGGPSRPQAREFSMGSGPATRVLGADREAIAAATRCLAAGGLVAFPTETVYGLGADAQN